MGVTFYPSNKIAEPFNWNWRAAPVTTSTAQVTFAESISSLHGEDTYESKLLTSSFPMHDVADGKIQSVGNGFVHTIMEAYNCHRHLIIRPDDVWLAILTQFSLFVNANAESLRGSFVAHEGQKNLHVELSCLDVNYLTSEMTSLLHQNITDPSITEWIMPNFTTTTVVDTTASAIIMMSTFQKYFSFSCGITCGFPSVTLEGAKKDYQSLLRRIEKLKEYGEQTTSWYHLLRPILRRFVGAFDSPSDPANLEFWNKALYQHSEYCGDERISGWITAFCAFNREGGWMGYRPDQVNRYLKAGTNSPSSIKSLTGLDGDEEVLYHTIDIESIPPGCAGADITLIGTGTDPRGILIAGLGAFQMSSSKDSTEDMDTVRPIAGWWLAAKDPEAEEAKQLERERLRKEFEESWARILAPQDRKTVLPVFNKGV